MVGNIQENTNHDGFVFAAMVCICLFVYFMCTDADPLLNQDCFHFCMQSNDVLGSQQQLFLPTTDKKPQLILHIEPVYHRSKVHAYGSSSETGKNRSRTYISDDSGYVGIGGFGDGDGNPLCFVVSQTSYYDSTIHWYDYCHTLDHDPDTIESIELNLPSLVIVFIACAS